jgi:hypothetical protein
LSRHVDVIWDQGHRQTYIPAAKRKHFISQLHCDYGTSGGFWVYPPQRWDRLRWFFPYVYRTGEHIRELYDQGGRGVMYYQGPTINPGVEMNLLCGGRLLSDASRDIDEVLNEAVNELYGPKSSVAQAKLVEVFVKPEKAYFSVWQEAEIEKVEKAPPPGELYLAPLFGDSPGGPVYISEPFLDEKGRGTYRQALLASYDAVVANRDQFHDGDRIQRLGKCIMNAIADLDTLAMCKNK